MVTSATSVTNVIARGASSTSVTSASKAEAILEIEKMRILASGSVVLGTCYLRSRDFS